MRITIASLCIIMSAAVCLTTILTTIGCGSGGGFTGAGIGASVPTRDPAPSFAVTIATDKLTYKTGDTINMIVSVTNTSTVAHTLSYPTGDPIVRWGYIIAQNGKIISYEYNTAHNLAFDLIVTADQYFAGETKTFNYVFPYVAGAGATPGSPLSPGTYQVYARQGDLTYDGTTAIRHATPTPASIPVTITITN